MSPNKETQNQATDSPNPSQEAAPEPQVSPLKATDKASPSLLRRCWSKRRALPKFIRWKSPSIIEYISGVLAEVRVPIVLGLLYFFLHQPIEQLGVKLLVAPVLAHFDTGALSSLLGIGLALALMAYAFLLGRRRYIVGGKVVLSAFFILLGYGYYRFARPDFEFYGLFDKACPIVFADLIPLACFLTILLRTWTHYTKPTSSREEKYSKGFLVDHPLTKEEEDICGWRDFAVTLTKHLLATNTEHAAFTLGIVASWGEGKSSFMGIMQRYLLREQRNVIVMRFNPWLYDKEAQLTKVFFEELRRTLAPYSSKLSRSIENYADLLLAVDNGWLKFAHQLLRLPQRSTAEQFDQLSRDIQELGKKVVIFIDDVDRLTREELLELFNLVRNSSNLPCLYFVLAYDKSYVLKTLQSEGEHMSRYPEKILQEEYPLPKLTITQVWSELENLLKIKFKEDEARQLIKQLHCHVVNLHYHLTSIRKVKRLVNGFFSRYEQLKDGGIDSFDLFVFELIHYVYPIVHEFLGEMYKLTEEPTINWAYQGKDNMLFHIEGAYISTSLQSPWIRIVTENIKKEALVHKELPSFEDSPLGRLIVSHWGAEKEKTNAFQFSRHDQYQIELLIQALWGENQDKRPYRISNRYTWKRYFYHGLLEEDISTLELESFLGNSKEGKIQMMHKWSDTRASSFTHLIRTYSWEGIEELREAVWIMFYWNSINSQELFKPTDLRQAEENTLVVIDDPNETRSIIQELLRDRSLLSGAWVYTRQSLQRWNPEQFSYFQLEELLYEQSRLFEELTSYENDINKVYELWVDSGIGVEEIDRKRAEKTTTLTRERITTDFEAFLKHLSSRRYRNPIPWESREALEKFLEDAKNAGKPYSLLLYKPIDEFMSHEFTRIF